MPLSVMSQPSPVPSVRVAMSGISPFLSQGRLGVGEAQAGAVAVGPVAAVVKDGEQVLARLDGQAAGVAGVRGSVVAGTVPAHAQRIAHRAHPATRSRR